MYLQDEWSTRAQNEQQCIGYNKHKTCYISQSTQAYSDARTLTWIYQKGYITSAWVYDMRLKKYIVCGIYSRALKHTVMQGL